MLGSTFLPLALAAINQIGRVNSQVIPTGPNGVTNPSRPEIAAVGTTVNQTSDSRLLTLNSVDDFCIFAPPVAGPENTIGNTEPIVVAYCTKPRNGARLIPDGTIHSAHFVRTPAYVQINGFWDGTRVNIPFGDSGGELDPHGPNALGNPVGGNVTSNVNGTDTFYEEWMSFVSYDQFCMRICTAEVGGVSASLMCEHELDVMGCAFVLPSVNMYNNNSFTSCEADVGAAPGLYPQPNGSTSTFRQRYTGSYTDQGTVAYWTVGQEVTPAAPFTTPSVSSCTTYPTISNGINTANFQVVAQTPLTSGTAAATTSGSTSRPASTTGASSTGSRSVSGSASGSVSRTGTGSGTVVATTAAATTTGSASKLQTFNAGAVGAVVLAGVAMVGGGLLVLA